MTLNGRGTRKVGGRLKTVGLAHHGSLKISQGLLNEWCRTCCKPATKPPYGLCRWLAGSNCTFRC